MTTHPTTFDPDDTATDPEVGQLADLTRADVRAFLALPIYLRRRLITDAGGVSLDLGRVITGAEWGAAIRDMTDEQRAAFLVALRGLGG